MNSNRRVAGAVLGLVSAGLLLAGGQAIAAPASSAPAATPASAEQLIFSYTGTVSATVNGGFKLKLDSGATVDIVVDGQTQITVGVKVGVKVKAVCAKINGVLIAGLVVAA
ncbi:hypothetical protein AB5J62_36910 [Amycolatopsis sp. cg5]|uniref:hypothetical protein n=1 Tax=Amycolatopsis sp. cg5 TaxID=3238802 RepID=UPI00352596AD